ncbi:MAG: DUF1735 domain-containing protein, partial [Bacteroidia bacterium]|nr:DUF1735 domain-containing protein [Bacteroidia bacterium]
MKKLMIILGCAAVFSFSGCDRFTPDFGDFDYTAVYFPHQYPIRTLSLGEDYVDNSLDRELKFNIGVGIGGLRENTQSWQVGYIQDPALLDKIRQVSGDTLLPMPTEYFSMANNSEFTIPAGSFSGLIQVQMSQNFLQDPLAWGEGGLYVIPLRITSTNADSILFGRATTDSPDRRIPSDYDPDAQPRDFTLFAVKYVNEYHGSYLHRGIDIGYDNQGAPVDTAVYSQRYVVDDQIWRLATKGRNVVHTNGISQLVTEGGMIYS